jgi:hypothetical protein
MQISTSVGVVHAIERLRHSTAGIDSITIAAAESDAMAMCPIVAAATMMGNDRPLPSRHA